MHLGEQFRPSFFHAAGALGSEITKHSRTKRWRAIVVLEMSVPKPITDFDVHSHLRYKSTRVVTPPGEAPPTVRTSFAADRRDALSHKARSALVLCPQKSLGGVPDSASPPVNLNHS
jgi:hypothetical protein